MKLLKYKKIDAGGCALLETHDGQKFWRVRVKTFYDLPERNYPFNQFKSIDEFAECANKILLKDYFEAPTSIMGLTKITSE